MRLITWNCCTGFDRKAAQFFGLNPDIAIVPECSQNDVAKVDTHGYWGLWFGSNPKKGLAVFCRRDWRLKSSCEPCGKWVTRIQLDGTPGFNLLAVWACPVGNRLDNYIGQVYRCVTEHAAWFSCGPVVIAGDFNSNARWDKERPGRNHSEVVRLLESYGVLSAYHAYFGEKQGAETRPTHYFYHHQDKPFHLDYVFAPKVWRVQSVQVGSFEEWGRLSDHVPVTVDLETGAIPCQKNGK
jgi:exodeoxyribonuclease III